MAAAGSRSAHFLELALQVVDLVAQAGRVLEAQIGGRLVHLLLEGADEAGELVLWELGEVAAHAVTLARATVAAGRRGLAVGPDGGEDVGYRLADGLGVDAVLGVVG